MTFNNLRLCASVMSKVTAVTLLVAVLSILVVFHQALAEPLPETPEEISRIQDAWVRVYDDKRFTDNYLTIRFPRDEKNLDNVKWETHDSTMGDKVSSLKYQIPRGWALVLFDDENHKDNSITLSGSGKVREIGDLGSFSDKTSSFRWERVPD